MAAELGHTSFERRELVVAAPAVAGGAHISIDVLPMSVPTGGGTGLRKRSDDQLAALERRMAQLSGHV